MILNNAMRTRNAVEYQELDWTAMQAWFQRMFFSGEELPTGIGTAETLSPIAAAHRILTNSMSLLPIGIYRKKDGARHAVSDDALDWVLKIRASDTQSPALMKKVLMSQAFWYGVGYAWIRLDESGTVQELLPLYTKDVTIKKDPSTGHIWYDCNMEDIRRRFAPSELIIVYFETYDGVRGRGVLDMARDAIATDAASQRFARKFYQNGARMSGIVEVDADLGPDGRNTIKKEFSRYAAGGDDNFKVAVLDRGYKYTPMGLSQSDAQFIEGRSFSVGEVSRFTGIPEFMLQSGKQAYNSNQQQQLSFVTNTLMAHVTQWEQEWAYKLLARKRLLQGEYMKYNLAALLRGDDESRAKFYQIMVFCGIYNPDECRAFEEKDPLPDGLGEHYFMTKNLDTIERIVKGEKRP